VAAHGRHLVTAPAGRRHRAFRLSPTSRGPPPCPWSWSQSGTSSFLSVIKQEGSLVTEYHSCLPRPPDPSILRSRIPGEFVVGRCVNTNK
jgi:hypothetical protein